MSARMSARMSGRMSARMSGLVGCEVVKPCLLTIHAMH